MTAHWVRPYNTWAIVSVCFGASTIIGTWCFGGIIAIVTRTGEAGGTLALVGLIAGYVSIGLFFLFILVYVAFFVFFFTYAATHATPTPSPSPVVSG